MCGDCQNSVKHFSVIIRRHRVVDVLLNLAHIHSLSPIPLHTKIRLQNYLPVKLLDLLAMRTNDAIPRTDNVASGELFRNAAPHHLLRSLVYHSHRV